MQTDTPWPSETEGLDDRLERLFERSDPAYGHVAICRGRPDQGYILYLNGSPTIRTHSYRALLRWALILTTPSRVSNNP